MSPKMQREWEGIQAAFNGDPIALGILGLYLAFMATIVGAEILKRKSE